MTKKRSILNLREMRAKKEVEQPVITDQNGKDHPIGGLTLGSYLDILALEDAFTVLQSKEDSEGSEGGSKDQIALIERMKEFILSVLPEFPVNGLFLDELFLVIQAIQSEISAGNAKEGEETEQGN